MTKHKRTKRRIHRGGSWLDPSSWFSSSSEPYAPSVIDKTKQAASSGLNFVESGLENISNSASSYGSSWADSAKSWVPFSSGSDQPQPSTTYIPGQTTGQTAGKRNRRKTRKYRGGKGGLGLTYYASPVSGLKVAEPTYWIKGGSRRRRRRHRK